jgi:hypothetical protein
MRHSIVYGALCALGVMIASVPAKAIVDPCTDSSVTVTIAGTNTGISSIACTITGNTIHVDEQWSGIGSGVLMIAGLVAGEDYTFEKTIYNNTQTLFASLSNELFDLQGVASDDQDGLSFAQGAQIPREGGDFTDVNNVTVEVDELDDRDYLNFYGGVGVAPGESTTVSFGLRDYNYDGLRAAFLLVQTPNFRTVPAPEPGTLLIFGLGLAGLGVFRRKKFA